MTRYHPIQNIGRTYAQLIKFGRLLGNHSNASNMAKEQPEIILSFVMSIERQLRFSKVDEFFSIFPPIKEYQDDGTWDYNSTLAMRHELLGSHFGKDDLKHLLMTSCYENKWIKLVGFSYMMAISSMYKRNTGTDMMTDFLHQ